MSDSPNSEEPEFMEQAHHLDETIENRPVEADTILQLISKCRYGRDDLLKLLRGIQTIIKQIAPDLDVSTSSDSDFIQGEDRKRKIKENKDRPDQLASLKKGNPEDDNVQESQIIFDDAPLNAKNFQFSQFSQTSTASTSKDQGSGADSKAPAQSSGQITSQQVAEAIKNTTKAPTKAPAIIIRSIQGWTSTRKFLIDNEIPFKSVFNTSHRNKIQTPTMEIYRKTLKLLRDRDLQHYTFLPAEERDLHVVIRGSGMELTPEEVMEFLKSKGFSPIKVMRMIHPITRVEMPLLLVILPKNAKGREIYNLKEIWDINISVEALNRSPVVGQCRRCLLFGHNHTQCFAKQLCKHCGDNHDFKVCPTIKGPKKCANCGDAHRASFRGCKRAPAKRIIAPQSSTRPIRAPAPAPVMNISQFPKLPKSQISSTQPPSYQQSAQPHKTTAAQVLKRGLKSSNQQNKNLQNIQSSNITNTQILHQMQATMQSMAAMFASMCEMLGHQ